MTGMPLLCRQLEILEQHSNINEVEGNFNRWRTLSSVS